MKNNGCKRAFTLIELLVVVLIIGILAAIALPQYQKAVEKAKSAEMMTFVGNAIKATQAWLLQNGGFPSDTAMLLTQGLLDVDLASGLTCVTDDGADYCYSKNYGYAIDCLTDKCFIELMRMDNGDQSTMSMYGGLETFDGKTWTTSGPGGSVVYKGKQGKVACDALVQNYGGTCTEVTGS
ncbi:MAG: type II secretion system protein [Elusimicrobiaceae bacterium]|nr:type II secretion system protein [Elusimicrobiaceae bacterium]